MAEQTTIPGVETKEKRTRKTYPKLRSVDDIPESRSQLYYEWMINYTMEKGTPEQCAAVLTFVEENQVTRASNLKTCKGFQFSMTDIKGLRSLFCEMFFPELSEPKAPNRKVESQLDMARRCLAQKAIQAKPASSKSKRKAEPQEV